ncbi:GNAT family protein [Pseudalkalibacillus sp. SCS-8]|uniref:GNAT family N-acetyltransferase n=1 Tax=Pseudalkalibacillus nanhaiensis TaxID=3115291 RepID=UPI0032DB5FCE
MSSVHIKGDKVILRDLQDDDLDDLYYWNYEAADREHLKWNGPYYKRPAMEKEEFKKTLDDDFHRIATDQTRKLLVIEVDRRLIGTVNWYWEDEVTNWLSNGIVIFDSRYWSGGYGTEAFTLWTDYIFKNMDVVRVGISTWSGNDRMIRLARKIGMVEEGCIRKARIVDGEYFDAIKMGVLREEWNSAVIK